MKKYYEAYRVFIIIMGVLLFTAIMFVTQMVWVVLEVAEYGHPTPSIADTLMGLVLNFALWIVVWNQRFFWRFIAAFANLLLKIISKFY